MNISYVCERAEKDGCPTSTGQTSERWRNFQGACYIVSDNLKTYDDARAACEAQDASLVNIHSAEENSHVQKLCDRRTCWIGLSEPSAVSEEWAWHGGDAAGSKGDWIGYINWENSEPNNWGGFNETAAFMNHWGYMDMPMPVMEKSVGKWYDTGRGLTTWYVCEKPMTDACPDDEWHGFEGACYSVSDALKNYGDASRACSNKEARLVSIESAQENAHVQNLCGRRSCWIGLAEPQKSEQWHWSDGRVAGSKDNWSGYTNWNRDEPNNWAGRDEDAVIMNFWVHMGLPEPMFQERKPAP